MLLIFLRHHISVASVLSSKTLERVKASDPNVDIENIKQFRIFNLVFSFSLLEDNNFDSSGNLLLAILDLVSTSISVFISSVFP